jgi:acyl carrier protein phosphodiesterase
MNYLAHLFLADDSTESLLGALLGDFVKGSLRDRYTEGIRRGIELHRKVDTFTDSHETVRQSKSRISPARRRFAGIIIDVFYDHFLAKNWSQYSQEPLSHFANRMYDALLENQTILPDRLQQILPFMIGQNWLCSYREIDVIDKVLNRMSQRIKRENSLEHSTEELVKNYDGFEADFNDFFPDLTDYAKVCKQEAASEAEDLLLIRI